MKNKAKTIQQQLLVGHGLLLTRDRQNRIGLDKLISVISCAMLSNLPRGSSSSDVCNLLIYDPPCHN